jgi:arsenate reductase-like glutaredoxin family protein
LRNHGIEAEERDVGSRPLTVAELEELIGPGADRHLQFLNPRNELYRERGMKDKPPGRAEALKLMSAHPNLMRRPILVVAGRGKENKTLIGFDEQVWKELIGA